jgi:tRNA (guanine37-N1)-methyltransferase
VLEVSIGDYVLNGGEVAAMVMIEAITRLIPGFMGNSESIVEESHSDGLLEYPSYTKPSTWRELEVPAILLSGHHAEIQKWRRDQQVERTKQNRPDLLP